MYHKLQKNAVLQHILNYVLQTISHQLRTTIKSFTLHFKIRDFGCIITFLLIFSFATKADWSTDITNSTPVFELFGIQMFSDTMSDGVGGAWFLCFNRQGPDAYNYIVQHFDNNASPLFSTNGVAVMPDSYWNEANIMGCSTNYVDVIWSGWLPDGGRNIQCQRIGSDGQFKWNISAVDVCSVEMDDVLYAFAQVDDGYIIFYHIEKDVYAQKILFDGNILWGTNGMVVATNAIESGTSNNGFKAIPIEQTNAVLVWADNPNSDFLLHAQKLSSSGNILWEKPWLEIGHHSNSENYISATLCSSNKILVTWNETINYTNAEYWAQIITPDGNLLYDSYGILWARQEVSPFGFAPGTKNCSYDNGNKVFFCWSGGPNSLSNKYDLCYQSLSINSGQIAAPLKGWIYPDTYEFQDSFCLQHKPTETIVMIWGADSNLFYQAFDESLNPLLPENRGDVSLLQIRRSSGKTVTLDDERVLSIWQDRRTDLGDVYAQPISLIPEPLFICFLFVSLMTGLIFRNKKYLLVVCVIIISSSTWANLGGDGEPSNSGENWLSQNDKLSGVSNDIGSEDNFKIFAVKNRLCRLEAGDAGYGYLGLYMRGTAWPDSSAIGWIEIQRNSDSWTATIEFGASKIDFRNIELVNIPYSDVTNHAANVQFVLDCMNGATNGSMSWCLSKFYPREVVDGMTNSVVGWVKDNYYQKDELYTSDEINNSFYNKTHINTNFYTISELYSHFNTNVYDKSEADNRFISITVATNISKYVSGQAITNLLDNGCAFKGPVYLDNNGAVGPMLQWRNPDGTRETHAYLENSKWRLENILNPLVSPSEKTVIELNSIDTGPSHIAFFVSDMTTPIIKIATNEVNLNTGLNLNQNRITGLEPAQNTDEPLTLGQWDSSNQIVNLMFHGLSSTVMNHEARIYSLETNIIELSKLQLVITNGLEAITNYLVTEITLDVLASELTNAMVLGDATVKNWALTEFYKKTTIDDALAEKLNVTGGGLTGNLGMNGNNIIDINVLKANEVQINNNLKFNGGASYSKIKVNDKDLISLNSSAGGENVYLHGNTFTLGDATVSGNLSVNGYVSKQAGTFEIDHPLDRENKILRHSFVESPDMMNIYNGNAILDKNGEAEIKLPDYFEALNKDFRYQLTPIGESAPNLYVKSEIRNLKFEIGGGNPGQKVSWTVTGIRQDAYAKDNRIVVEEKKKNPGLIYKK